MRATKNSRAGRIGPEIIRTARTPSAVLGGIDVINLEPSPPQGELMCSSIRAAMVGRQFISATTWLSVNSLGANCFVSLVNLVREPGHSSYSRRYALKYLNSTAEWEPNRAYPYWTAGDVPNIKAQRKRDDSIDCSNIGIDTILGDRSQAERDKEWLTTADVSSVFDLFGIRLSTRTRSRRQRYFAEWRGVLVALEAGKSVHSDESTLKAGPFGREKGTYDSMERLTPSKRRMRPKISHLVLSVAVCSGRRHT